MKREKIISKGSVNYKTILIRNKGDFVVIVDENQKVKRVRKQVLSPRQIGLEVLKRKNPKKKRKPIKFQPVRGNTGIGLKL